MMTRTKRRLAIVVSVVLLISAVPAMTSARSGSRRPSSPRVNGVVQVDGGPSAGWAVELYATGPDGPRLLDRSVSRGDGTFGLRARSRARNGVVHYVVASSGDNRMLVALGPADEMPSNIVVNELTTVASIWTNAQFISDGAIAGNPVGLVAAARNVPNLVHLQAGTLGDVVLNTANLQTNTAATMGTLAGLMADCFTQGCPSLFTFATPPGQAPPSNTLEAFHDIALNPWHNVTEIFSLLQPGVPDAPDNPVHLPTLVFPPTAWTLSLNYTDGGFNAPGRLAIDAEGNVWANNNFMVGSQSVLLDVGGVFQPDPDAYSGNGVVKLASNGFPFSPTTGFLGGGLLGGAFGLAIDQQQHVWVGNFAGNSLTEMAPDGTPISRSSTGYASDGGYHHDAFDEPQSLLITEDGSIWVTNLAGDTVSQLVGGDPNNIRDWGGDDCAIRFNGPWGLASDAAGTVFVTNTRGRSVIAIDPNLPPDQHCPAAEYPVADLALPQGIATDMDGNLWVADTYGLGRVTFLDASNGYAATSFTADDTTVGPWSIAVDGNNNVWVADFFGKRIEQLCGASGNCPDGKTELGSAISPAGVPASGELGNGGGYGANGALQSITSINIDQAGNVWAANNFNDVAACLIGAGIPDPPAGGSTVELERLQTECGGNGVVVMLGVAGPVAAPQFGVPQPL